MDGLSAASSGIAVVSIAIQLAESFKKLHDFWKSIKEAPEDIRDISVDLELLSSVLTQIAYEAQHVEPDAALIAALNGCSVKVKTLTTLLNEIEPGFTSKSSRIRKWTAFKAVLKHGELMRFQEILERLKGTLVLVQQNQYSRLSRNRHTLLERSLATITHGVSSLTVQQRSEITGSDLRPASDAYSNYAAFRGEERDTTKFCARNLYPVQSDHSDSGRSWSVPQEQTRVKRTLRETGSVIEAFLGTIRATSTTYLQTSRQTGDLVPHHEQDQYESRTSYIIHPASWLINLGINYGLHLGFLSSSAQGWKSTLKTFCPVPDDALIFEFCRQGNVPAVRDLLSRGYASVRDTDSGGNTPLHYAALNYHSELCKLLKGAGADIITVTYNAQTPMELAANRSYLTTYAMLSEVFDTFRLLIDSMDFLEENGDGWEVLHDLCESSRDLHGDIEAKRDLLLWMLRLSSFELKTNIIEGQYAAMLAWILMPTPKLVEASDLLLNLGGVGIIDTLPHSLDRYTVLHQRLAYDYGQDDVNLVLARAPDLHRLCFDAAYTPYEETPTSLAMYCSWAFTRWVRGLVSLDVNLENFLDQELKQSSEVHPGWKKETMLDLFACGDRPDLHAGEEWTCSDCIGEIPSVRVQPYWRHLLEMIKEKIHPDDLALADLEGDGKENANSGAIEEAASSSSGLLHEPDTAGNIPLDDLNEPPPEADLQGNTSEDPATTPIRSSCMYGRYDVVCMDCWLHYERTGTRRSPRTGERVPQDLGPREDLPGNGYSPTGDESSEDEFSPFLIHS